MAIREDIAETLTSSCELELDVEGLHLTIIDNEAYVPDGEITVRFGPSGSSKVVDLSMTRAVASITLDRDAAMRLRDKLNELARLGATGEA